MVTCMHKKRLHVCAAFALVAPLGKLIGFFHGSVFSNILFLCFLRGGQNAATCRKVATMVAAGVATFQIPPNLGP